MEKLETNFSYDSKIDIDKLNDLKDDFLNCLKENGCIELEPDKKAYRIVWPFYVCVHKRKKIRRDH